MTSVVSKEDLADELYRLGGPHKAAQINRLLRMIDHYCINVARTLPRAADVTPVTPVVDQWSHLKPGDTDIAAQMRRCAECGEVKNLERAFAKARKAPQGRNRRCTDCRPPANLISGRVRLYLCRACGERKPMGEFPEKKREHPSVLYHCLACIPQ